MEEKKFRPHKTNGADYLLGNAEYYEEQYSKGYGLLYPDSHIIRIYHTILDYEFGFDGSKNEKLLDYGCGTGAHSHFFSSKGFDVYGVDIDKIAIEKCQKLMPHLADHFKVIDPEPPNVPFFDMKYDVVISNQVLYYFSSSDLKKCVLHLYDQLKYGGIFVATMMGSRCFYFNNSTDYHDGLREVTLGMRIKGTSYINFTHSKKELADKFLPFSKKRIGYYDAIIRSDEGSGYHYIYIGQKTDG